ncbi:hypothetical protein PZB21_25685 [Rhizobium sp. CBK13]|uniref:hypothetical protein n=1 Tax=Rhizobium sp. CBK13 TaxID=3031399 RepID=UPI0023B1DDED|nr:hypothetical protein [Rhizobium sp. CBK13]MDE8762568.1 hypothetical protein [Rhizobium sp. CBK13]
MELAVNQKLLEHPDFRFADVAGEISARVCLPEGLTGLQTERIFDSIVAVWSSAKGYNLDKAVHCALMLMLMQMHGDAATLYRRYMDASDTLDDTRENGGDLRTALESYISSAIAYGDDEIQEEVAELRRLIAEGENGLKIAA